MTKPPEAGTSDLPSPPVALAPGCPALQSSRSIGTAALTPLNYSMTKMMSKVR